jgi:hypothetical protein
LPKINQIRLNSQITAKSITIEDEFLNVCHLNPSAIFFFTKYTIIAAGIENNRNIAPLAMMKIIVLTTVSESENPPLIYAAEVKENVDKKAHFQKCFEQINNDSKKTNAVITRPPNIPISSFTG